MGTPAGTEAWESPQSHLGAPGAEFAQQQPALAVVSLSLPEGKEGVDAAFRAPVSTSVSVWEGAGSAWAESPQVSGLHQAAVSTPGPLGLSPRVTPHICRGCGNERARVPLCLGRRWRSLQSRAHAQAVGTEQVLPQWPFVSFPMPQAGPVSGLSDGPAGSVPVPARPHWPGTKCAAGGGEALWQRPRCFA